MRRTAGSVHVEGTRVRWSNNKLPASGPIPAKANRPPGALQLPGMGYAREWDSPMEMAALFILSIAWSQKFPTRHGDLELLEQNAPKIQSGKPESRKPKY